MILDPKHRKKTEDTAVPGRNLNCYFILLLHCPVCRLQRVQNAGLKLRIGAWDAAKRECRKVLSSSPKALYKFPIIMITFSENRIDKEA